MKFFTAVALILFCTHAGAAEDSLSNGNGYLAICKDDANYEICYAYIGGALDVMDVTGAEEKYGFVLRKKIGRDSPLKSFCLPEAMPYKQLFDIVIKHIEETPKDRHFRTSLLIYEALWTAFPCS